MANIQLKIVDEGLNADIESFESSLKQALMDQDIYPVDQAEHSLKIKLMKDDGHDKVLLQMRESATKHKLDEEVILYFPDSWIEKTCDVAATLASKVEHSAPGVH